MPSLQPSFSPLFAHARPSVRPDEVAVALGCTTGQVRALDEQGLICAVDISDARERQREHLRFLRASVEGFYAWQLERRALPVLFDLSPEAERWRDHLKATALVRQKPKTKSEEPCTK